DVRVVLPQENDFALMHLNNRETAAVLAESGVKIHLYPGLLHLKAAVYDDWVCLGSANMDTLSLRINRETNIGFSDPVAVRRFLQAVVEPDLRRSRRAGAAELRAVRAPLAEILADQL